MMNLVLSHVLEFSMNLKYQFCIASFFTEPTVQKKGNLEEEGRRHKDLKSGGKEMAVALELAMSSSLYQESTWRTKHKVQLR